MATMTNLASPETMGTSMSSILDSLCEARSAKCSVIFWQTRRRYQITHQIVMPRMRMNM